MVRVNPSNPYRPVVRILRDGKGAAVSRMEVADLMDKEPYGGRFARSIVESIRPGPGGAQAAQAR